MKSRKVLIAVAGLTGVLLALAACFALAYFIDGHLYDWLGRRPSDLVVQLIDSMSGVILFAIVGFVVSTISQVREKQTALLQAMNEALQRIARGDFSVNLRLNEMENNHDFPFKELATSINYMAAELGEMERMRQEFISNVSHEIQSPLTSINGFAKALQSDELERDERLHYLSIIENESMRLSRLSENLLKLAALESEHPPFEPCSYRLDKQLRTIILSMEPLWSEKEIEMDVSLDETSVVADEELMSQVWVNLLGNSIKFTPRGGAIGVCLHQADHGVDVRISDTGIGISEDDKARIFERFFKADVSRNRGAGGSGLGLAIAKKIAEMHRATIEVESTLGRGTTLTLHLPDGL